MCRVKKINEKICYKAKKIEIQIPELIAPTYQICDMKKYAISTGFYKTIVKIEPILAIEVQSNIAVPKKDKQANKKANQKVYNTEATKKSDKVVDNALD